MISVRRSARLLPGRSAKVGGFGLPLFVSVTDRLLRFTSLISGHDLVTLQAPNAKTGAPGEGIFLGSGGFVRVEVPFWALTPPFEDRGVLMPQHRAAMDALKKPKGRFASWAMKLQDS